MIPESSSAGITRIYECTGFPESWEEVGVVLPGVPLVDPIIFEANGRWWLIATKKPFGASSAATLLCAWFADSPLDNSWQAHTLNPILTNSQVARNGGFWRDSSERVVRVSQGHGFAKYGTHIRHWRIEEITPNSYRETEVESPPFASIHTSKLGVHQFSLLADMAAFDSWFEGAERTI
jgi:hypothetical protein